MTTNVNATSSKNESQLVKTEESADKGFRLPETSTLQQAAKISIVEDKPILFDYWTDSLVKRFL
jgi:hypothetical protein